MKVFTEQEVKAIRIANLALLLQSGQSFTAIEVSERFRIPMRTAQRDLLSAGKIIPLVQAYKTIDGRKRPCWKMFNMEEI